MLFDLSKLPINIRNDILTNDRYTKMFNEFPKKLLGFSQDYKTSKGLKKGVLTGILYLSPADSSGVNLCPMSEIAKCKAPCLFTAGRGAMNIVQMGRLRKTLMYLQYPDKFKSMLIADIETLQRKAKRDNLEPMVRLNGTSDDTDLRPYDPQGVVVGLIAKGKARHDTSGFVVNN